VEEGETLEEIMMREVNEERSITPTVFKQIGDVEQL